MRERKTPQERIAALEKKEAQLRAQRQALIAKEKEAERKARTKRLIESGATAESVFGSPIEKDDLPQYKSRLEGLVAVEQAIDMPLNEDGTAEVLTAITISQVISDVLRRPLTIADAQRLKFFLEQQDERGSFFSKAMNSGRW